MFAAQTVNVIIPALDEADSIGKVLAAVPEWVDRVVVVDNGSADATPQIAAECGARVVSQPRRGYGRACLAGMGDIEHCDIIVFLDGDFSDHPEQMARLVAPVAGDQADMVIGSRTLGEHSPGAFTPPQRFGTQLACRLMNLLWRTRHTDLGPFRAIRMSALRGLAMRDATYGWTIEMQIKAARKQLRVLEVPVSYRRRIGVSKISGTVRGVVGAGWKILSTIARHALAAPALPAGGEDRLIVMGRYPMPGTSKTRLIPALGPLAAASLQRRMTEQTFAIARAAAADLGCDVEVRYAGGTERKMRRWLGGRARFACQGPGGLGERIARAFADAFASGARRVVVIGTDCPRVARVDLADAFAALASDDVVLGPSVDGGYWLIGLRRPAELFDGVAWGTGAVLDRTLELAGRGGLSVRLLRRLADIDTPADLRQLDKPPRRDWLSVIIPTLDEESNIAAAIASARCDGVEVIVTDGGSSDATVAVATTAGARVVTCPRGRGKQMNLASAAARGQVLLFLHADTVLPDGYAARVFDALSDRGVVGGAFTYQSDMQGVAMAIVTGIARLRARHLHLPYGDQGIFVRSSVFKECGRFPEIAVAEDVHFVRRLLLKGRIVVLSESAVTSARRCRRLGVLKTTAINQLMLAGCCLGAGPDLLRRLYLWISAGERPHDRDESEMAMSRKPSPATACYQSHP